MGFVSLTFCNSMRPISIWCILREALKLSFKNKGLMLPIILLSLLNSSLLFLSNLCCVSRALLDLTINAFVMRTLDELGGDSDYGSLLAAAKEDITEIMIMESIFFLVFFVTSSLLLVALIHASFMTYVRRHLTLKELVIRVKGSWKGPMITQLYATILNFCCTILLAAFLCFFALISINGGSKISVALGSALALLTLYLYLRVTMVWSLTSVVSVMEEGCYGLEAIGRAMEVTDQRRRPGIVISFLASSAFIGAFVLSMAYVPQITDYQLANGLFIVNFSMLLYIFSVMAYVVLYYECKKGHVEEGEVSKTSDHSAYYSFANFDQEKKLSMTI